MRFVLTLLCAGTLLAQAPAPTALQFVQKHTRAVGGEAAIRGLATLVRTGTFDLGRGTAPWPVEVWSKGAEKWQFIATIPDVARMEHVVNGAQGWLQGPDGSEDLPAGELDGENENFDITVFLKPESYFRELAVKSGPEGGAWIVTGHTARGAAVELAFDASSGLLTRIGDYRLEDFRTVAGLQLPFRIKWGEQGREFALNFEKMEANVEIAESRFDRQANTSEYRRIVRALTLPQLDRALAGIDAGPARGVLEELHNFTPDDGRLLYDLIVQHGCRRGLEVGTAHGNSAVWMGLAFQRTGGKLITLEMDPERAAIATANFRKAGLDQIVTCRNNDAFKEIPLIEGEFDWVFLDSGTNLHKKFLDAVYARVRPGGVIVSHNANGMERTMPDFLKAIQTDPNLETRVQHTPGGGVTISIKKR